MKEVGTGVEIEIDLIAAAASTGQGGGSVLAEEDRGVIDTGKVFPTGDHDDRFAEFSFTLMPITGWK